MSPTATEHLTPRARAIVAAARDLLEEEGLEGLSMRKLAARVGMRAPSLYKHFSGKEALAAALVSIGFEEQAALLERALRSSREPMAAMAAAYRDYALRHPQLYRLIYDQRPNRALLIPGAEDRARAPVIEAAGGDLDLARATWAFAHGMTIFELNHRFWADADIDAAWARGVAALQAAAPRRKRGR